MALYGVDISNFQPVSGSKYAGSAFVICKATEGVNFNDKRFRQHMQNASHNGQLLGAYHYARPEYNTAIKEAEHFLAVFEPWIGKAVPCLDWEQKALQHSPAWALTWLRYVEKRTGSRPLFYVQQSQARLAKYKPIADAGFPLWLAQYSKKPGPTVWPKLTMWQYTSNPLDKDVFYGGRADWYGLISNASNTLGTQKDVDSTQASVRKVKIVGVTKRGMKGVQVKGLQEMLKGYGYYKATIDGDFGAKTEEAVKAFQKTEGLDVDGIVGKATWSRLAGLE